MRAGWVMAVMRVVVVMVAGAQEYGTPFGHLKASDVVVTEQGLAQAVAAEGSQAISNAVNAGYLCTVAKAAELANTKVSPAQLAGAVAGMELLVAPLASTQWVAAAVAPVASGLTGHTGNEQIHLTLNQAARIAGAVQTEADPVALPRVEGLEAGTSRWDEAHGWGDHSQAGYLQPSDTNGFLRVERDYKALCLYHYGSSEIEPSPAEWFGFIPEVGGITSYKWDEYGGTNAGMEHVVIPWEIDGVPVENIGSVAFLGSPIVSVIDNKNSRNEFCILGPPLGPIGIFNSCSNLEWVVLHSDKIRGSFVFNQCTSLTNIFFNGSRFFRFGPEWNREANSNLVITVTNPQSTGWGTEQDGTPVVRPALHTDKLVLNGVEHTEISTGAADPEWQIATPAETDTIAVTSTLLEIQAIGDAVLTLTGLTSSQPVYAVICGANSLTISSAYWIGGGVYQAGRRNHYMIWQYGDEVLVNAITTTTE